MITLSLYSVTYAASEYGHFQVKSSIDPNTRWRCDSLEARYSVLLLWCILAIWMTALMAQRQVQWNYAPEYTDDMGTRLRVAVPGGKV
jgi:hypothetical protein